jgi:uncharacterized protein (DUF1330 family)
MSLKLGPTNTAFVHLTYVPWIAAAGELKTKPTQHTVQKLREIGIQPDVLLCRADRDPRRRAREDLAVHQRAEHGVISMWDVDTIYKVPRMLHEQGLDELICMKLQLLTKPGRPEALGPPGARGRAPARRGHHRHVRQVHRPVGFVQVAQRGAAPRRHPQPCAKVNIEYVDAETLTPETRRASWPVRRHPGARRLRQARRRRQDRRAQYAREHKLPYLGICLGMQVATIEYARHVAGLAGANSTEFDPTAPHPVIALIDEWQDRDGRDPEARRQPPTWAAPCAWARRAPTSSPARWRTRSTARGDRAPPPPLRGQRQLPRPPAAGRPGDLGHHPAREADRDRRAAAERCTPGSSACSSTPSSRARPGTATRCSSATSRPRWRPPAPQRRCRGLKVAHEALRLRRRPRPALLPDRRPLRGRERAAADGHRRPPEGNHVRAGHSVHLQEQLRQGQPLQRHLVPRPGHGARAGDPGQGAARAERAHPDRRAHEARSPRWPPWSTCCRRRPSCAARPISSARWRQRQAGEHQEGPVPRAGRHEERDRQGRVPPRARRPAEDNFMACERGASASATTTWCPTCAAWPSCARPAHRWCSTPPTRCNCPAARAPAAGGQREFVPVLARAAVAWAWPACSWKPIPTRPTPVRRPQRRAAEAHAALLEQLVALDRGQAPAAARERLQLLSPATNERSCPAYVIAEIKVSDPEQYKQYMALSPAGDQGPAASTWCAAAATRCWKATGSRTAMAMLRFPSYEQAKAFYDSAGSTRGRPRQAGGRHRVLQHGRGRGRLTPRSAPRNRPGCKPIQGQGVTQT